MQQTWFGNGRVGGEISIPWETVFKQFMELAGLMNL